MIFTKRVALITGASQGIGEAIAEELGRAGSAVVLVDIQRDKLGKVAERLSSEGIKALPLVADVTRFDQVNEVTEKAIRELGKIDFLINNAGITRDSLLLRMKEEDWDLVLAVNLKGAFNFSRAVLKHMFSTRFGRIVNVSSVVGLMGNFGQANYAASKAGLIGFSKSLAREVAPRGITVNCVAPGYIATQMTEKLPDEVKKAFLEIIPMKRFGLPVEVAWVVKFLCSDEAAYITGQVISVNGGMYM
ncbi:MAG: 3-oxoacyl-[acyl-carrier-protein] reductase [Candidatus Saccharicenans sp.]|nr:MAG: 3-oxoacyl-[acyl-carrier-protein] reductase [Candidatus Aminicenantes bacterium]HEK85533.1 3-oxoacyl-[acyl-carrier-protein] reductase [Candidatus Aminicenantes bacterium]